MRCHMMTSHNIIHCLPVHQTLCQYDRCSMAHTAQILVRCPMCESIGLHTISCNGEQQPTSSSTPFNFNLTLSPLYPDCMSSSFLSTDNTSTGVYV